MVRLDARTALALLRLTQEGLANVAKHAGTSARVRLTIRLTEDRVQFELIDSGGSPSQNAVVQGGGHGLVGLRERMEVLGGTLEAGPADGGWRLAATIPIAAAVRAPAPTPPGQAAPPEQAAPPGPAAPNQPAGKTAEASA